jgi:hypothetical protein
MNRKWIVFSVLSIFTSCENKDINPAPTTLVGKWRLIEVLADPGDGSGVFTKVTSDRTISFLSDSTFTSNSPMCLMGIASGQSSKGIYFPKNGTISPADCQIKQFTIRFKIEESNLILSYPCIEACSEKYIKELVTQ